MSKDAGEEPQHCLTPPESLTIIAPLCAVEAKVEKRLARLVVSSQAVIALIAAGIVYSLDGTRLDIAAVLSGGLVSTLNGAMLAWRMSRAASLSALDAHCSDDAHRQLRLMYVYAIERFLVVVVLLGICMASLKFPPFAVLSGFVLGQATLLVARLFLNR